MLLREEPEGEHTWQHEEGDVEIRRADQTWGIRRNTPEDDRRREEELQARRAEEAQRDEEQQQAARQATAKAKGIEQGKAMLEKKGGFADKMPSGKDGKKGVGKDGKKGDGKDGKKGDAKNDKPKGKGKEPATKDDRGKLVTNVAAAVVMPTEEKGKAGGKAEGPEAGEVDPHRVVDTGLAVRRRAEDEAKRQLAEETRQEVPEGKGEAKAKGQREPEPAPQKSQAQQNQWRTHWEREEEKQSRGEWGTAGAQQQSWQDKWNASQRKDQQDEGNDQQAEWRGKWRNW